MTIICSLTSDRIWWTRSSTGTWNRCYSEQKTRVRNVLGICVYFFLPLINLPYSYIKIPITLFFWGQFTYRTIPPHSPTFNPLSQTFVFSNSNPLPILLHFSCIFLYNVHPSHSTSGLFSGGLLSKKIIMYGFWLFMNLLSIAVSYSWLFLKEWLQFTVLSCSNHQYWNLSIIDFP